MGGVKNSRLQALEFVADWTRPTDGAAAISTLVDDAEIVAQFIEGAPVTVYIRIGLVRDQATGAPSPNQPGGTTTMQIHDNEQFDITVTAVDAKGQPTTDAFTASSDNEAVATVVDHGDGTFTILNPTPGGVVGSAVVTVTDGTNSATEAVDVIAGDAVAISIEEGPVVPQPTA